MCETNGASVTSNATPVFIVIALDILFDKAKYKGERSMVLTHETVVIEHICRH